MGIYGWAFDGFPIYGPFGYDDGNDAGSTVVRITSKYKCEINNVECTTVEKQTAGNWAYSSDNDGHLDDRNGRWTKTPEFPNGMYVYVLNVDSDGNVAFPGVPYCLQSGSDSSSIATTESPSSETTESSSSETTESPSIGSASGGIATALPISATFFIGIHAML